MGSWNKTCGITQFPIHWTQKTVSFVLVQQWTSIDVAPCYSNAHWNVVPVPFFGEYNDYGGQKDEPGQEHKYEFLRKHFGKDVIRTPKYEPPQPKSRKKKVEPEKPKWERYPGLDDPFKDDKSLNDSIHDNKFALTNRFAHYTGRDHLLISRFMIHRTVYDKLTAGYLQDYPKKKYWTKAEMIAGVDAFFAWEKKQIEELEAEEAEDEALDIKVRRIVRFGMGRSHIVHQYQEATFGNEYSNPLRGILSYVGERYTEGPVVGLGEVHDGGAITSEDIVSFYLLTHAMSELRKSYYPQGHEGSQEDITELHDIFIEVQKDLIVERKKMYDDWDEDEEETDE